MKTARVRKYSALEVANLCGVVNQTAINWIKKNYLTAHTTPGGQYRVYAEDLAIFMNSRGMKVPQELNRHIKGARKNILFIDDNDQFAWQFLGDLKAEYPKCEIDRASDGFEAGAKVVSGQSDLVIINADMDGLKVHKVCKVIRNTPGGSEKSIIVFREKANSVEKEAMLHAGADVYISKPFDIGHISIYLE